MDKFGNVFDRMLPVRIEGYYVGDSYSSGISSQKLESGLKCRSTSSIVGMLQIYHIRITTGDGLGVIFGAIVHHTDFLVSRCHDSVDNPSNTSRFVVRSDEKTDIVRIYFFGFHVWVSEGFN